MDEVTSGTTVGNFFWKQKAFQDLKNGEFLLSRNRHIYSHHKLHTAAGVHEPSGSDH